MAVNFEIKDHIAIITIDRPEARNAVNGDVAKGIEESLDRYEEDDTLWVAILTGSGPIFCAGADLKAVSAGKAAGLMTAKGGFAGFVQRKRTKPVIGAINGPALAGGCELSLACDLVVASKEAYFGLPEVKRALIAVAGGLIRLPKTIGPKLSMEMILTGEPIDAKRAYELGMVNRLAAPDQVLPVAIALAEKIAENAPLAVQASRNLASRAFSDEEETLWNDGFTAMIENMMTEDAKEGPLAFIEKRAPRWKAK